MPSVRFPVGKLTRQFAVLTLAAAAVAVGGCQGAHESADAAAQQKVDEARQAMFTNNLTLAASAATAAGQTENVSPRMAYTVHMLNGQIHMAQANDLLGQAQESEIAVNRLMGQINLATMQVSLAQSRIKATEGLDPGASIDDLKSRINDAMGANQNADWSPPKLPEYKRPVIEAPTPQPAAASAAAPQSGAPATGGSGKGISGFFSAFLGKKPAVGGETTPAAPPATEPSESAATQPAPSDQEMPPEVPPLQLTTLDIHSAATLDADIARLTASLAANADQAQKIASQRTALLSQADDLEKKSLAESGQQSVDDMASSAETGRQAAELSIDADKLSAAATGLKADLAKARMQQAGVKAAVDGFNRQVTSMELSWKGAQQNIDDEKHAIADLIGPAAPGGSAALTIADACSQLKTAVADYRDLRGKAADQLNQAAREFKSAIASGRQCRDEFRDQQGERVTPGERTALQQLLEVYSENSAQLANADAERSLAINYSADAITSRRMKECLTTAQTVLGGEAPSSLTDCLAASTGQGMTMEDFGAQADDSFKNALDGFTTVASAGGAGAGVTGRKAAALAGTMITAYGAKQLSLAMDSHPVAGQTPTDLQTTIDSTAKDLTDLDPTALPAVPYTIPAAAPTPG